MAIALMVVSLVLASIAVQAVQGIFMSLIGAKAMFINGTMQVIIIIALAFLIYGKFFA